MKKIRRLLRPFAARAAKQAAPETPREAAPAPSRPLQVILFIGHHKVGSTSLQDYLSRNAAALSRAGILYPYVDFEGMAHLAATAAGRGQPEGSLPINVREPHNALAFRMLAGHSNGKVPSYHKRLPVLPQMVHAIQQQIRFAEPHTVILAAEVFANFNAAGPELIQKLAGWFPEAEFTLVATLRRIDEYVASWHGQRLKFGHQLAPLRADGLDGYFGGIHFDYRLMLEGWLKTLPEARVILRDYAEVRAGGGSVADFIAQTGLQLPEGLAPERRENDSFHRAVYEIARLGNHRLEDRKAAELRRALRALTPELELPPSRDIELFGADNRQRMLERFRPIDDWLGGICGRSGFFADLEQALEVQPLAEEEAFGTALAQVCGRLPEGLGQEAADFVKALQAEQGKTGSPAAAGERTA
ncbi:hypothetical protein [Leisingera sp. McT4-56]|uniref:hypothetical protein n=1 Tax=Leisingera sp. McT4-56 TaxID=2881255 RepID=UPI001CF82A09|nr:hypothetical protein [Leisingera sp. McT4-56]MCB4457219.1 hypothetical protein [Leisingera sp. McT4-56]